MMTSVMMMILTEAPPRHQASNLPSNPTRGLDAHHLRKRESGSMTRLTSVVLTLMKEQNPTTAVKNPTTQLLTVQITQHPLCPTPPLLSDTSIHQLGALPWWLDPSPIPHVWVSVRTTGNNQIKYIEYEHECTKFERIQSCWKIYFRTYIIVYWWKYNISPLFFKWFL